MHEFTDLQLAKVDAIVCPKPKNCSDRAPWMAQAWANGCRHSTDGAAALRLEAFAEDPAQNVATSPWARMHNSWRTHACSEETDSRRGVARPYVTMLGKIATVLKVSAVARRVISGTCFDLYEIGGRYVGCFFVGEFRTPLQIAEAKVTK